MARECWDLADLVGGAHLDWLAGNGLIAGELLVRFFGRGGRVRSHRRIGGTAISEILCEVSHDPVEIGLRHRHPFVHHQAHRSAHCGADLCCDVTTEA